MKKINLYLKRQDDDLNIFRGVLNAFTIYVLLGATLYFGYGFLRTFYETFVEVMK